MRTFYTCASIAAATILSVGAMAQNLIVNPGFETATLGVPTGTPLPFYPATLDGWGAVNTDGEFILGPAQAHNGNGFMSMLENGGQNPGTSWLGASASGGYDRGYQEVDVLANTTYLLSYWYRAGDGSRYGYGAGSTLVQVEEVLPTFLSLASAQNVATSTWQQGSITFTTGAATTRIIVLFSALGSGSTDTWYDDVDLHGGQGEGVAEHGLSAQWSFDAAAASLSVKPLSMDPAQQMEIFTAAGARTTAPVARHADSWAVDLSGLSNGVYIAVLRGSEGYAAHKVMLAR
ncbi:MAG: hypothetical protein ABI599_12785 [Flavobacteriales bacterium]